MTFRKRLGSVWMPPISSFIGFAFAGLLPLSILAVEKIPVAAPVITVPHIEEKNFINGAIQVQITPKGFEIYKTKLKDLIITQADFDPSDVYFDPFEYEFKKPIRWEELNLSPENLKVLKDTRKFLSELLVGFSLNEMRPLIQVGASEFTAKFSRFALIADEGILHQIGKKTGAVLTLELEIQKAVLQSQYVKVFDLNNDFTKKPIGVESIQMNVADAKKPLKMRIPFYVAVQPNGVLHFEVINLESNLNSVDIGLKYGNVLSPKISLVIDDKKWEVDPRKISNLLADNLPTAIVKAKDYISNFAQNELPKILNEKAKESFKKELEEIQPLAAPGSDNPNDHFFYGLQLGQIYQDKLVHISLNAFAEDHPNYAKAHQKPLAVDKSKGPINLSVYPMEKYDIGVGIDRGLINRILQLSFERKFFEKIPVDEKQQKFMKLTKAPTVDALQGVPAIGPSLKETKMKLNISLRVPKGEVSGLDKMAIKDQFEMSFEAIAKLKEMDYPACGEQVGDKGINILLQNINVDSLKIDDKWLTGIGKLFRNKVMKAVKGKLTEIVKEWGTEGESVGGCFAPPKEILGLKLEVQQLGFDPNGHLMMYFDYAKENNGSTGRSL